MAAITDEKRAKGVLVSGKGVRLAAFLIGVPVIGLVLFYMYTLLFDFAGNQ
jgi:hypothetical protein